jgi:hypothetical protein
MAPSSAPSERSKTEEIGLWYLFYLKMLKQMSIASAMLVPPLALTLLSFCVILPLL